MKIKKKGKVSVKAQKIVPCLWYDDKAEEAANFYVSVFRKAGVKDSSVGYISRYGKSGAEVSGRPQGSVLTVDFRLAGQAFTALNGGPIFKFTEAVSFIVNCEAQEEVDYFWEKLHEGGEIQPCGWVKDKYGLSWQIVPTILEKLLRAKDPVKVERVMSVFLKMTKIEIKALKEAYVG